MSPKQFVEEAERRLSGAKTPEEFQRIHADILREVRTFEGDFQQEMIDALPDHFAAM